MDVHLQAIYFCAYRSLPAFVQVYQKCNANAMHIFGWERFTIYAIQMYCEVNVMGKFKIPEVPPTVNKTIRFPTDVVTAVEKEIQGKNCTFSGFVIAAVRAVLDDLNQKE